jgi:Ser/Thr protein kinase RdoA (MazF antagonist)
LTNQLQSYFQDDAQDYWRALALIQPAESRERLNNQHEAEQVGFALGHFHWLCSELSINSLFDTLPGFHITPDYYQQYLSLPNTANTPEIRFCRQFIHGFQAKINCLEHPKQQGQLKQRVIHGDPKLNNFLFKPTTDQIISLIDLDTVKPGLLHYDIGDCLRSCCHTTPSNQFDLDCCASILKSYLAETKSLFSHADYRYLYAAIQLIPFELGLRFFSDYLAGNQYFKVAQPEQNLYRALDLFQLTKHIEQKHLAIEKLIVGYQNSYLQQN